MLHLKKLKEMITVPKAVLPTQMIHLEIIWLWNGCFFVCTTNAAFEVV